MSYAAMTHDIVHLIEKLKIERCILVGHSMGGKTVMSAALQHPTLVEKLIVVDSAPTCSIAADAAWKCIKAMMDLDFSKIKERKDVDKVLATEIKVSCLHLVTTSCRKCLVIASHSRKSMLTFTPYY